MVPAVAYWTVTRATVPTKMCPHAAFARDLGSLVDSYQPRCPTQLPTAALKAPPPVRCERASLSAVGPTNRAHAKSNTCRPYLLEPQRRYSHRKHRECQREVLYAEKVLDRRLNPA
jgi:hypothetical protein